MKRLIFVLVLVAVTALAAPFDCWVEVSNGRIVSALPVGHHPGTKIIDNPRYMRITVLSTNIRAMAIAKMREIDRVPHVKAPFPFIYEDGTNGLREVWWIDVDVAQVEMDANGQVTTNSLIVGNRAVE